MSAGTTEIVHGVDTDTITLLDFDHAPVCEATYNDNRDCDQPAKFICSVKCCMGKILLCEDCFFAFLEYCRDFEGIEFFCAMCDQPGYLTTDHLKLLDRI